MIRNLKAFGLALFALMAVSALVASAAQAQTQRFRSEAVNTTLTVTQDGTEGTETAHQIFNAAGGQITCAGLHGEASSTAQVVTTIQVENITYTNCKFLGFINVVVEMHSCDFQFTSHDEVSGQKNVKVVQKTNATKTCNEDPIQYKASTCTVKVGEQPELTTAGYHSINNQQEVTIEAHVHEIQYTANAGCPSGSGQFSNGTYEGNAVATGEETGTKTMVKVWWE